MVTAIGPYVVSFRKPVNSLIAVYAERIPRRSVFKGWQRTMVGMQSAGCRSDEGTIYEPYATLPSDVVYMSHRVPRRGPHV